MLTPNPPPPEPPGVGCVIFFFFYRFSGQFMTFPGVLTFDLLTPKIPTSTPPLGGEVYFF